MKKLIILVGVVGATTWNGAAQNTLDIAGLVYYSHVRIDETYLADPVREGTQVILYKRTADGDWTPFAITVTDVNGKYVFDDIDIGATGLFENSDWFRVTVNAKGKIPGWPGDDFQTRFAYRAPRPGELPDPGLVRVDVIYAVEYGSPLVEAVIYPFKFRGRIVDFDAGGQGYMPGLMIWLRDDPPPPWPHEASCPVGENEILFGGCQDGDWWATDDYPPGDNWPNAAYAEFIFFQSETGFYPNKYEISRGYSYYHPEWPYWGLYGSPAAAWLVIDIVDKPLSAP
jgi:uncharacterized protein YkuJ